MEIDYSQIVSYSVGVPKDCDKDIKYILAGNGSIEVRENEIAVFSTSIKKIPGLDEVKEGVILKLPKIPLELLLQTITFFKDVNKLHSSEAIVQIYWNRENKSYYIYCPKQKISGAAVDFTRDKKRDKEHLLVVDIHSHNTMDAFFSGTDNADEKEARLYGVIGKIDEPMPKMLFRASTGHGVVDIPIDNVFDISAQYPKNWLKQIEKKKEESFVTTGNSLYGKQWDNKEWYSGSISEEKWDGKKWVKDDKENPIDCLFPELAKPNTERIDILELREQLLEKLGDDDKDFIATELLGSIQAKIGGIDNGGYPVGK